MRVRLPPRLIAVLAAAASLAASAALWSAREDEQQLAQASAAGARGDLRGALAGARELREGTTIEGRAAAIAAAAAFGLGDLRAGTAHLRRAVRARPNDWRLHRDLAVGLAATGRPDAARRAAARALELNPRVVLPPALFNVRAGGR